MFGWAAPWPLQFGGGMTPVEAAYSALLSGVGKGHAADVDGIEWRWRQARAIGIAIAMTMGERALNQFFPATATSGLPFYAELFQLFGSSDQEIRDRATQLSNDTADSGTPSLLAKLKGIDPSFEILEIPWADSVTTVHGAGFEGTSLPFNYAHAAETQFPNYSSAFIVTVAFNPGGPPPSDDSQLRTIAEARALLDDELPAWVDFSIGSGAGGFILDSSHLDWDRFNP